MALRFRELIAAALALTAGLFAPSAATSAPATQRWESRFERALADWPGPTRGWGFENHEYTEDSAVQGRVLRVHIHKGSIDPGTMVRRGLPRSGSGFKARVLAPGADSATLEYLVRFPENFDFVRGGKLPGLFGGAGNSGGAIPNGLDGFSFRLMWREGGKGEVYAYLPTSKVYGTSLLQGQFVFVPGQWHRITQQVVLNTPGLSDGEVSLWLDGKLAGTARSLRIRDSAALKIDGVFFDLFFGGNDDSWAASADTYVEFAQFSAGAPAPADRR